MSTAARSTVYSTRLLDRFEVAEQTMAFRLAKPDHFVFKAGQSIDVSLIDPPETDEEGNTRTFSLASAPEEESLLVATRMRDTAFKRVLGKLPAQSQVQIDGPHGHLLLHGDSKRPAVLLAGGIGITPFRGMLRSAASRNLPHRIFLFYSNRRPQDAAFLSELLTHAQQHLRFKMIPVMTRVGTAVKDWKGETGHIGRDMLTRYLKDADAPVYYIAGPPVMVSAMQSMLNESGVNDDDIRVEEFSGY